MKKIILMVIAMVMTAGVAQTMAAPKEKKQIETTTFEVDMECQECVKKIMNYIPMQKGIEDVKVDLKAGRVTVTFNELEVSNATIIKYFAKIKKKAKVYVPAPIKKDPILEPARR
ncbi:MAG: heavy-metal-associated domain-containing protein [Rikenellaceae bacterium]